MQALNDQVIAEAIHEKEVGGLSIPETALDKPQKATVVSVGSDVKNVQQGDAVVFRKNSATKLNVGKDYLVVRAKDLIAIL